MPVEERLYLFNRWEPPEPELSLVFPDTGWSIYVDTFFAENGLLARCLPGFEPRSGQLKMAQAVAAVLEDGAGEDGEDGPAAKILVVEAETGIGKTLAYLLPAVLSGQRLVISTATINLQDQILQKEIPLISRLLNQEIPALCVKGRQNYLCLYRWFQYRSAPQLSLLEDADGDRIETWLQTTTTGDRAELAWLPDRSQLWVKISAQSHQCLGNECPEGATCFVNQLRRRAGAARLLIVNHHLFFSDLSLKKAGYGEILPRYEGVIFDEAHHLENVATTFFGITFSHYQLLDLLGDIERQAQADLTAAQTERLRTAVGGLGQRLDRFVTLFPQQRGRYPLDPLVQKIDRWREEVEDMAAGLDRLGGDLANLGVMSEGWHVLEKRAVELKENLITIALPGEQAGSNRYVRWYERRERALSLSSTPINISGQLQQYLYPSIRSCILTSATLTTGGDFPISGNGWDCMNGLRPCSSIPPLTIQAERCYMYPRRVFRNRRSPAFPGGSAPGSTIFCRSAGAGRWCSLQVSKEWRAWRDICRSILPIPSWCREGHPGRRFWSDLRKKRTLFCWPWPVSGRVLMCRVSRSAV